MISHTRFFGQKTARWTLVVRVAVVQHRVRALVGAYARMRALGHLGAAPDGRIEHGESATAVQLVERGD